MKVEKIGQRNITLIYEEPFRTTTHLVIGEHRVYVCDTFIGTGSMKLVEKVLKKEGVEKKPVVVFNSHADWDHIWGNCYFQDAMIISHRECRNRMIAEWKDEMKRNAEFKRGEVILSQPTEVFDEKYIFEDDGVEFYHSSGHTIDSSSCYDRRDKVLFVGDNVESNLPYVNSLDFDIYISSLEEYLSRDWTHLVPGHDPVQTDDSLVRSNIDYLKRLKKWDIDLNSLPEKGLDVHLYTLSKLVKILVTGDLQDEVKRHYRDAIKLLEEKESTEKIRDYLNLYRRVLE